jgi:hypothetical protein
MAAVEYPGMIARILLIRKFGAAALPFQGHSVFGHVICIECARARRNRDHNDTTVAARLNQAKKSRLRHS